jgi:hypothetical protein
MTEGFAGAIAFSCSDSVNLPADSHRPFVLNAVLFVFQAKRGNLPAQVNLVLVLAVIVGCPEIPSPRTCRRPPGANLRGQDRSPSRRRCHLHKSPLFILPFQRALRSWLIVNPGITRAPPVDVLAGLIQQPFLQSFRLMLAVMLQGSARVGQLRRVNIDQADRPLAALGMGLLLSSLRCVLRRPLRPSGAVLRPLWPVGCQRRSRGPQRRSSPACRPLCARPRLRAAWLLFDLPQPRCQCLLGGGDGASSALSRIGFHLPCTAFAASSCGFFSTLRAVVGIRSPRGGGG